MRGIGFPLKSLKIDWAVEGAKERSLVSAIADFRLHLPYGPVGLPVWLTARRRLRKEMEQALGGLKDYAERQALADKAGRI